MQFDQLLLLSRDKGNWNHPMLTSQPSCTYRKILGEIEFSIRKWCGGGGGETIILCARTTYLDPRVRDITKLELIIYLPFVKTVQWNYGFWNWWSSFFESLKELYFRDSFEGIGGKAYWIMLILVPVEIKPLPWTVQES